MPKNFNLKKIAGNIFKNMSKSSETGEINPRRDWRIIMTLFALAVTALIIFGSYMYWKINSGSLFVVSGGNELLIEIIDRVELKKTFDYYEAKKRIFEEIKIKKPQVVDPSL